MPSALRSVTQFMKSTVWKRAASGVESIRCVVAAVSMTLPPVSSIVTRSPSATATRPILGRSVRANLPTAELYEDAIRRGEGLVAADGPLA